jgi:hypothetical protein
MTKNQTKPSPWFQMIVSVFILTSCQLDPLQTGVPPNGIPPAPSEPAPSEPSPQSPVPSLPVGGSTHCKSNDPDFQCLALKIVSYEDPGKSSVLSKLEGETLVSELNKVWSPCKIGFQLEQYESINPITLGLQYDPNWRSQGSQVRSTFSDNQTLLLVATGKLTSSTIAVTQMPGYAPFGTLVEDGFADNPLTVGHELGHYMGLYHFRNTSNLMNPYIGTNTQKLTSSQCEIARSTNAKNWAQMLRY